MDNALKIALRFVLISLAITLIYFIVDYFIYVTAHAVPVSSMHYFKPANFTNVTFLIR